MIIFYAALIRTKTNTSYQSQLSHNRVLPQQNPVRVISMVKRNKWRRKHLQ